MARFLLTVPPMTGHTLPLTSLSRVLERRGHETAWVADRSMVGRHLPGDARIFSTAPSGSGDGERPDQYRAVRGAGAFRTLVEGLLVPYARATVPTLTGAAEAFEPDLVVVEQLAWGGGFAARRLGLPWCTVAASFGTRRLALRALPPVTRWLDERLERLQLELELEPLPEPEASPLLNLVLTTRDFVWGDDDFPDTFEFVGPVTEREPDPTPFPWEELGDGPSVLVSLGSVENVRGERFYAAVAEGLADLDATVVVVAPDHFGPFPGEWIVRSWVPQLELLGRVDAVVTHGGMNTVHEALAEGLPLVVAPIVNDQGYIAECVAAAGAGLRISFGRPRPEEIREAVARVLGEPSLRAGAEALARSFERAGGAECAADLLEALAKDVSG